MKRLWFIAGNFAVPLTEISGAEMRRLLDGEFFIGSYPTCWAGGVGVWPSAYASDGKIVQEISLEEIMWQSYTMADKHREQLANGDEP